MARTCDGWHSSWAGENPGADLRRWNEWLQKDVFVRGTNLVKIGVLKKLPLRRLLHLRRLICIWGKQQIKGLWTRFLIDSLSLQLLLHISSARDWRQFKTKVQQIPNRRKSTEEFSGLHCALCVCNTLKRGLVIQVLCFINWKHLHYAILLKSVWPENRAEHRKSN